MISSLQRDITRFLDSRPSRQSHHSAQEIADGVGSSVKKVKRAITPRFQTDFIASSKLIDGSWHYNRLLSDHIYDGAVGRGLQPRVKVKLSIGSIEMSIESKE